MQGHQKAKVVFTNLRWWLYRDTPAFTPGPGAYKAPSSFSRRPFRLTGQKQGHQKAKLPVHQTHLPPSVPSKAQSYG